MSWRFVLHSITVSQRSRKLKMYVRGRRAQRSTKPAFMDLLEIRPPLHTEYKLQQNRMALLSCLFVSSISGHWLPVRGRRCAVTLSQFRASSLHDWVVTHSELLRSKEIPECIGCATRRVASPRSSTTKAQQQFDAPGLVVSSPARSICFSRTCGFGCCLEGSLIFDIHGHDYVVRLPE